MREAYIQYITDVKRYSPRTQEIYADVLQRFETFAGTKAEESMTPQLLRSYEAELMSMDMSPRTVHQHMSVLSGFARFLIQRGVLESNPVKTVRKPKMEKRLPVHYRQAEMEQYLAETAWVAESGNFEQRLRRLIVHMLYAMGLRRAELIDLEIQSFDPSREIMRVKGKGDKMRDIPIISSLSQEISLYLNAAMSMEDVERTPASPLLITPRGGKLYPEFVDRAVKAELDKAGIQGRKSPHALRHTLATSLLEDGASLTSIKEVLGHSSLAATQVYTHATVERLKNVYANAHPRAKKGNSYD